MGKYAESESESLEFKREYSDTICKEIVSFLNADGGDIVLGVANDGTIVGLDKIDATMRKISDIRYNYNSDRTQSTSNCFLGTTM